MALAADPSERNDPIRGQWFKSLRTNPSASGLTYSCCDVSDCSRVEAAQMGDAWFIKRGGDLIPVPPGAVLKDPPSIDGEAYACVVGSSIRCFVPPVPGF